MCRIKTVSLQTCYSWYLFPHSSIATGLPYPTATIWTIISLPLSRTDRKTLHLSTVMKVKYNQWRKSGRSCLISSLRFVPSFVDLCYAKQRIRHTNHSGTNASSERDEAKLCSDLCSTASPLDGSLCSLSGFFCLFLNFFTNSRAWKYRWGAFSTPEQIIIELWWNTGRRSFSSCWPTVRAPLNHLLL